MRVGFHRALLYVLFGAFLGGAQAQEVASSCSAVDAKAQVLMAQERNAEAETLESTVLSQLRADSPCRASFLTDRAYALQQLGRTQEAEQSAAESVKLLEAAQGPTAPSLRQPLLILGQLEFSKNNFNRAAALLARADALADPSHSYQANSHGLKGCLLVVSKKFDQAEVEFNASLAERALAGDGQSLSAIPELMSLALLYQQDGRPVEALTQLTRAATILDRSPDSPELSIYTSLLMAMAHAQLHETDEAHRNFERAVARIADLPSGLREPAGRNVYSEYVSFLRKTHRKSEAKEIARQEETMFGPDRSTLTVSADSLLRR